MRVLIVGHPRSGTTYIGHAFCRAGWKVGHERPQEDGISSWMWAANSWYTPNGTARGDTKIPPIVLHVLRDPARCVSSVYYVEGGSENWRRNFIKIPSAEECGAVERAIWSIYGWTRLIRRNTPPTHVAQVERVDRVVAEITGCADLQADNHRNTQPHPRLAEDQIGAMEWVYPETHGFWDDIKRDYKDAAQ